MPEWSAARGCNLHQFNFTTGRETRTAGANAPDASRLYDGGEDVAFARVYERRRGRLGDRAYLHIRGVTGATPSRQVPAATARGCRRAAAGRCAACTRSSRAPRRSTWPGGVSRSAGTRRTPTARSRPSISTRSATCTRRQTLSSLGSGEIQAQELIGSTIDAGRVTWARVLFGDSAWRTACAATPCSTAPASGPSRPRPGPPRSCSPCSRSRPTAARSYLVRCALGGTGRTVQSLCLSDPGCTDTAPCELRLDPGVAFTRYGRASRRSGS